ncbi:MAG TPA: LysR family transcriptional regulator [Xanthobacteraceae bacterium]|jgi:LysR family transcriptional regulator of gallate degradation|nr:LysR family transcriptional regulator [Xanthobacteraceae bacterium]
MITREIPSLRQLRVFEAVARLESVSAAARDIHLSQPGVSQAIRALENGLGAQLFERRQFGCYVTALGAILLPRVRRFLEYLRSALTEPSSPAGRQSIDATVNRMTRPQLQSLIAVSENPSFDAAARSLRISQPSLHRSARELERELRRSLYRRTATGVTTTPYGSELARRVQVALGEIEYGLDELQAARGNIVSRIAIGNIPHSATQILSNAIKEFLSRYPTARVRIVDGHYEDLLNELRAGKLDLLYGVLRRPDWAADVKEELLFANHYVVVARNGHPLHRLKRVRNRDLANFGWIMPGPLAPRQQALHRILETVCAEPKISLETTSLQIYRTILTATDQLTLMSRFEAKLNDTGSLAQLPFRSPHLRRFDGIATRIGWQPTNIHLEFIALLRAEARGAAAGTQPRPSSRSPTEKARRRATGTRVKIRTGVRKAASHVR